MKRFHLQVHVSDLNSSVRFCSVLFGAEPTVLKTDYAKWMARRSVRQLRDYFGRVRARHRPSWGSVRF